MARKSYPPDVVDEEWALVAPYLTLLPETAGQREHRMREVFDALRWLVRSGAPWRLLPTDFPPWHAVYDQTRRWLRAGCFERLTHDLRALLRAADGREPAPRAAILDSRTLRSTPESGHRAGYDGAKRKKGSKIHAAMDTLGHLLALHVTPANADDRAEVGHLAEAVQDVTGERVEGAFVDQGYVGQKPAEAAARHGIQLEVVKLPEAKKGFVLLPRARRGQRPRSLRDVSRKRGWVVERSFAWATRFRRLVRDYERLPQTVAGLHFIAFACLMLHRFALAHSP